MDASASSRIVSAAQPLKDPDQLIDSVETFIFDCDGGFCVVVSYSFDECSCLVNAMMCM